MTLPGWGYPLRAIWNEDAEIAIAMSLEEKQTENREEQKNEQ